MAESALATPAHVIDSMSIAGPALVPDALIDGGMTAIVADLPIFPRTYERASAALARWNQRFAATDRLIRIDTVSDLARAASNRQLGIILACQDASILGSPGYSVSDHNLQNLRALHQSGLRILQLTHNDRNGIADSFWEKTDAGLSRLGEAVVDEMDELGIVVDLAHCSRLTLEQCVQRTRKPRIVSHTGCRSLFETARNKSDDEIRAVAESGGLVGVFNMTMWLTLGSADVDAVIDHIDHVVNLVGEEHAAFGGDQVEGVAFDPVAKLEAMQSYVRAHAGLPGAERLPGHVAVPELIGPARMLALRSRMHARGYTTRATNKILGGNLVRVLGDVCG